MGLNPERCLRNTHLKIPNLHSINDFSMTMRTIKYEFKKTKEANSFPSPANFVKPGTCHHIAPLLNDSHVEREKSLFAARSIDNTVPTTKCEFLELTQEAKLFPSSANFVPSSCLPAACLAHANCLCFDKS